MGKGVVVLVGGMKEYGRDEKVRGIEGRKRVKGVGSGMEVRITV